MHLDTQNNENPINREIGIHELRQILTEIGNSCPGPDNIPNILIKNLPVNGIVYILDL